jgi:hypothetical protein
MLCHVVSVLNKLLSENNVGNLHYQISSEKFQPEPGFEPRSAPALYHLSYPGSHARSCSNLPLETDATLGRRDHDNICHLLTTSELTLPFYMNMILKSNY